MLRDKLSSHEKEMIERYIDAYIEDGAHRTADADYILREWAAKKEDLYHMLGDRLIVSRPVSFKMGVDEIMDDLDNRLRLNEKARAFRDHWTEFFYWKNRRWDHWYYNDEAPKYPWHEDYELSCNLRNMTNYDMLALNVWDSDTFIVPFPDGTEFKVQKGAKLTKAIGKIVNAYSDKLSKEEFEAFRIVCSQALNQKELHGTLTLSIHPLDYMTMSDNSNQWSSCMSWQEGGCYRQGTVEMMNSPMVVVAYLASNEPMSIPGGEWNSKKWRELIVVNRDMVTNILGYPYRNEHLSRAAVDMVKELAEKFYVDKYVNEEPIVFKDDHDFMYNGSPRSIHSHTNYMYNDFHNGSYSHIGYFGAWIEEDRRYKFTYSGASECMACGDLNPGFDGEGCLAGECCWEEDNGEYCDYCEESYHGESHYVDGMYLCDYCYDNHTVYATDGETHIEDNCTRIDFMDDKNHTGYVKLYVYDRDHLEREGAEFFKYLYRYKGNWGEEYYYVNVDGLTDAGFKFIIHNEVYNSLTRDDLRTLYSGSSYGTVNLDNCEKIVLAAEENEAE